MNSKSFLAVALGAITHFFLGFLLYGILLADYMQANITHYEGLMAEGGFIASYAASSIVFAILMTYILNRSDVGSAKSGLITGTIVTLLISLNINIILYFQMNLYSLGALIADTAAFVVMGGATGWVTGFMLSRGKEVATAEAVA